MLSKKAGLFPTSNKRLKYELEMEDFLSKCSDDLSVSLDSSSVSNGWGDFTRKDRIVVGVPTATSTCCHFGLVACVMRVCKVDAQCEGPSVCDESMQG